jgi:hypothetical protein
MFLYEVIDAIESVKIKYALVGGYALALHGIVRATMDVDLVISLSLKDFELVEQALLKKTTTVKTAYSCPRRYKNAKRIH